MATSDSIETGGPAFPLPFPHKQVQYVPMRDGMTLRDYFAAKALQSVIMACAHDTREPEQTLEQYFAKFS